jgi:hypothetical protein
MNRTLELFAPKIYYFHPLLAGPRDTWAARLRRCRDLGFDHVVSAPLYAPGKAGDLFLTADQERAHRAIEKSLPVVQVAEEFAQACRANDLSLLIDVVLGRMAADAALAESRPDWFRAANAASATTRSRHILGSHATRPTRCDSLLLFGCQRRREGARTVALRRSTGNSSAAPAGRTPYGSWQAGARFEVRSGRLQIQSIPRRRALARNF